MSTFIARPAEDVYRYAADPANLPHWATGLAGRQLERIDGDWIADSPMGRVTVEFAPPNSYGVLDHDVTLPDGQVVYNPVRVIAAGDDASEIVFTIRRRPEMTDDEWTADVANVTADLDTLRQTLEKTE